MAVNIVIYLFFLSMLSSCTGFLLPPNNTGGNALTDEHYMYIMGLLGQEKGNTHKMEQFILKLNNEMKSLQQQVHDMARNNGSSQITNLQNGYNDLQVKLMQVKQELAKVQHYNYALNKDNERLQSEINVCSNTTMKLQRELESFTHSIAAEKLENISQIQSNVENLGSKMGETIAKLNALASNSNARSQDFLALLNQTMDTRHRITTMETETKQNLISYQNITNKKINDAFQRITSINQTVALTSCAGETTVTKGSTVKFPYTKTVYGISDLNEFQISGNFTCEVDGLYLFSVFINSKTNSSEYGMYKNDDAISLVYIVQGSNAGHNLHTGTGIVAVRLDVGDILYVKPFYDKMYVHGSDSCMTVIKLR